MIKYSTRRKYKKVTIILSIIIMVVTLNALKFPAFTENNLISGLTNTNQTTKAAKATDNGLTPIKTVSTKDYITMNLYDYGTNINNKNLNNKGQGQFYIYPGFVQSKGLQSVDFSGFSDAVIQANANSLLSLTDFYYLGDYVVKDYDTPTAGTYSSSTLTNATLNSQYNNTIYYPLTDQMSSTLVNDYPEFHVHSNGSSLNMKGSLDYLFSNNTYATKYGNLDGLFQYDEDTGLYYYSSRDNHAELHGSTFKVYNQIITPDYMKYPFGNFLPFNYINTQSTQVSTLNRTEVTNMIERLSTKSGTKYSRAYHHLRTFDIAMAYKNGTNYTAWDTISTGLKSLEDNGALSLTTATKNEFKNSLPNLYNVNYDEEKNFFFGFDMKLNFMQTKDGLVGKNRDQKMVFRFEGDDDVWVYIDGYLFLDLSGVHAQVGGEIDFHDGVVRYYSFDKTTFSAGNDNAHLIRTVKFQDILGTNSPLLEKIDDDTYRFKEYSTPELRFYYLERGASSGVMTTQFNLPLINEEAITISKEVSTTENTFGNQSYKFQVMKNGSEDQLFIAPNTGYDVYSSKTQDKLRSETTDAYGIITLNKDEYAVIDGIKENAGKYYIRELIEKDLVSQYANVKIDGNNVNFSSSTVTYGSKEYVYAKSAVKDMADSVRITSFINVTGTLGKLKIKKTLDNINPSNITKPFKFKVEINGKLIPKGTKYTISNKTYTVSEKGYIELNATEEATIDNIFKNTTFKVTEVLETTDGFIDRYVLDSVPLDTKYASGTVTSVSIVEVINSEAGGALIKIPVKKITTNPDGIGYTYTFILYDSNGSVIETKELTVDPTTGTAESSGLFEIEYSRLNNPNASTTYQYTLKEDKKTKLGDIVVNNDENTSYDETVYNIEVTVTNNSSGFNATYKVNGKTNENIVFNNARLSSLTINKIVESNNAVNTQFNFDIECETKLNGTYSTNDDGKKVTFTNGKATVTLKDGESVTIKGLPYGSKFKVTETNSDGYTPMYKVNTTGYKEGSSVPEFTLTKITDTNSTFGVNYDTKVTFKNIKGYELPKTGSSEMLVITIVSIVLMSISSLYLLGLKKN